MRGFTLQLTWGLHIRESPLLTVTATSFKGEYATFNNNPVLNKDNQDYGLNYKNQRYRSLSRHPILQ